MNLINEYQENYSVLVIEQIGALRSSILSFLKNRLQITRVFTASHEREAKNVLKHRDFDLVICGHYPPEVNALEVAMEMRKIKSMDHAALVVMSTELNQGLIVNALKAGASEFILKPFQFEAFEKKIIAATKMPIKKELLERKRIKEIEESLEDESPATVLVVDDIADNIHVISQSLKGQCRIRATTSAKKALSICQSDTPPELVLLDVMMPDMDGLSLCAELKSNPKTQHIGIIFVTALGQDDEVVRGLELGALDYVVKPIIPEILKLRVGTHLKSISDNRKFLNQLDLLSEFETAQQDLDDFLEADVINCLSTIDSCMSHFSGITTKTELRTTVQSLFNYTQCLDCRLDGMHLTHLSEGDAQQSEQKEIELDALIKRISHEFVPILDLTGTTLTFDFEGELSVTMDEQLAVTLVKSILLHAINTSQNDCEILINGIGQYDKVTISFFNVWFPTIEERLAFFERLPWGTFDEENSVYRNTMHSIISKHDGDISFDFDEENGTNIFFSIPKKRANETGQAKSNICSLKLNDKNGIVNKGENFRYNKIYS